MSNKIYFTPGPAQLFYTFEEHLKRALFEDIPSISHRSKQFNAVVQQTTEALIELLNLPAGYQPYYINSANEAWDRIIQNLVKDSSHHFVNGAFSKKFFDFALAHNRSSSQTLVQDGEVFENWQIPVDAELIGITKNETSVGFTITEKEISELRVANKEKLIALDIVSALPGIETDFKNVDTAYFSVQKAFGMPAGLGVWIANERCHEVALKLSQNQSLGSYRALPNLKKFGDKYQTPETPNMLYIYLLGKIAEDMVKVGQKKIKNDTIYKSTILNQAIEDHPNLTHFVKSKDHRSKTTLVATSDKAEEIIKQFAQKGLILGSGYGKHAKNHIRIANFPTHSKESIEMVCDLMEK
ncbi:MAG: aminotransferase class V-fold PLP-dependent enzyme [Ekhidna sp.]|nr:aminotransferase class V-fold PLP-dependent enzyme [Ekhidna sp.]